MTPRAAEPLAMRITVSVAREGAPIETRPVISSADDAERYLRRILPDDGREHMYALLLTRSRTLIGVDEVGVGGVDYCNTHPREIYRAAVVSCASAVIIAHNHPAGTPEPSTEDVSLTRRMIDCGKIIGISLLDSLVLGSPGRYTSIRNSVPSMGW